MPDTTSFTPGQMQSLRRFFHAMNHFMVFMWKIGLGRAVNFWPAGTGRIMVIRHCGRKSGKEYLTPVNYAVVDGEVYCMAGFGPGTDWYRNLLVHPQAEIWLPEGRRRACAMEVSDSPQRLRLFREIAIASGFAAPLFGIDPRKLTDEQMREAAKDYRFVQFKLEA